MTTTEEICWAILVPGEPERVAELAAQQWRRRFGHVVEGRPWEVLACDEGYTAIVERDPGSEGPDDPVAQALSGEVDGPVFLLRFRDEAPVVWVYERGRWTGELNESPESVAERWGCPFATEPPRRPVFVWCHVEDATRDEVVRALGDTAGEPWCRIDQEPSGVVVHSTDNDIGGLAYDLSGQLPARPVHEVLQGPEPDRFTVTTFVGASVLGESVMSADETAATLRVPRHYLEPSGGEDAQL
jgi:hypothetical protein